MMNRMLLAAALALTAGLSAQDPTPKAAVATAKAAYEQRAAIYPMTTCVVAGEELAADAVTFTVDGTTFKTCCEKCQAKVTKDPATYKAKLEAASQKAQLAHYPLSTCVISGEKLGDMGEPVQLMLEGTLVQLCCKDCIAKAKAKPAAMAQKVLDAAYAAQQKTYPVDTCIVSGEKLDADAKDVMFGTMLIRTCCNKCVGKFEKDPAKYLAKLHADHKHGHDGDHKGESEHGGKKGKDADKKAGGK